LGIQIPGSSKRKITAETKAALQAWRDTMVGTPFHHNMVPASPIPLSASADACASAREAGIGGLLRLNGNIVAWFSFAITLDKAQQHFSWVSDSMQKHINVWDARAVCFGILLGPSVATAESCD
jgi:hypothetical protein